MTSISLFAPDALPDDGTITKAAYADRIGVSRGLISQYVREGMPELPSGRLDPQACDAWIKEGKDPNRRKAVGGSRGERSNIRAEIDAERLRALQIKNDREAGNLIDRATVKRVLSEQADRERKMWMAWPSRVAPRIAAKLGVEPAALAAALDTEIHNSLTELSVEPADG